MDLKSIHEIFKNRILRIPSYQRGYSWANNRPITTVNSDEYKNIKGQLMDLWNDITNIPDGRWHYTGLLTLVDVETPDYKWLPHYKQYAIVDGQQRITTILILIAVMIKEADRLGMELGLLENEMKFQYLYIQKAGINAYIFGYDQDNPSDKFFRKHVLNLNEIEDDSSESVYTENLKKAKEFFIGRVQLFIGDGDRQQARLQELFDRVTGDLKLNEYILPKELDEYVVFETMNNRGKPLSGLEKLKNRLMYLGDKFENIDSQQENSADLIDAQKQHIESSINKGWTTIYQALGANKEYPLDDEGFIKNHWITYFDRYSRNEANVYASHLFNEQFTLEQVYDNKISPDDILDYVKSLQESAIIWNKIHYTEFFPSPEVDCKEAILGLHRVGFRASFKPLVLAALRHSGNSDYLELIKLLEAYAFKLFHVSDRQSNTGDSKLYKLASQIYHSKSYVKDACNDIQAHMSYYYSFSLFKNQIQELFETGKMLGYYEWSGLHYFLFKYDMHLRSTNQTSTKVSELHWEDFRLKNTIEHIFPQSAAKSYDDFKEGKDSPERKKAYDMLQKDWSAFSVYNPEQRKRLCNSLGNLLAISNSDNASFSNDSFVDKVDQANKGDGYKKRGYSYDSMSAQVVAKENDWTPELVKDRGLLMLDAMLFFLGEDKNSLNVNEKITLLGLEFMI
ncbi:MAG: DUF262 domain-containing protein [Candidatus Brocadiales bacterium]|nr:DUF262 domain-containing protein [Candidatus Brocadiales bacterium]